MMSKTHLVEIDLLRAGEPLPMLGAAQSDYRILVSASGSRPQAQLYAFNIRQEIPQINIPLLQSAVTLDLQSLVHQVYDRARFKLAIDYQQLPYPQLSHKDRAWLSELLQQSNI
jgi:Protein of unknown function (DUF4058)